MTGSGKPKIKTVNIFLGFFFVVNFCLGTGFLGVPYSFFYSGYLAAIPTLLLICIISWINANYLLEVMARAQALEYFEKAQRPSGLDSSSEDDANSLLVNLHIRKHPTFEITVRRKFEVVELCEIFFNKWIKYLYLVILNIYCFLASWSFATVAGSSWAINIPYNFSGVEICEGDPFHHSVLPAIDTCRNAYYFSLFLYAVIVVSLSLVDLKEQAIIQMVLGLMRFLTVGAIIVYALARIAATGGEDECLISSNDSNDTSGSGFPWELTNATRYSTYGSIFTNFDAVNWLTAIPIFTYAFILHQGIASLTHPIKQKRYMRHLITAMFSTAFLCYTTLGVIAPLWFKYDIQETVTLNFSKYTSSDHSLALRLLAYYLLLFPSLDVVSAYPLMVHTVVNNLYIIIMGRDTSASVPTTNRKLDLVLRLVLRLIVGTLPILAAMGVANLVYVLKYAGLMGFNICFFFPTVLQWRSMSVCKKKFAPNHISVSGLHSKDREQQSLLASSSARSSIILAAEKQSSLLSTRLLAGGRKEMSEFMTPYSSVVFSHPIAVIVVGVVGVCLFLLTVASLGVHPSKLSCDL